MANPGLPDSVLREMLAALEQHGNPTLAARALNLNRSTFDARLRVARARFDLPEPSEVVEQAEAAAVDLPVFPDDDISAGEILDHLERRFEKRQTRQAAEHWFPINVRSDAPIGLAVIGDPHLGPNCNIGLLRRHVEVLANTPGMLAINIGDTADNWGRLVHLYAEDDISRPTERRLARWFLGEAGIPWVAWLAGNHEEMHGEFSTFLKSENVAQIPMLDWRARFRLVFQSAARFWPCKRL